MEVYEPEFKEKVTSNISGMKGKISNEYTVIPAFKGKYPIPEVTFSYFDPSLEKYISLQSKPILINVIEGPLPSSESTANNPVLNPVVEKQQIVSQNEGFGFIKTKTKLQAKNLRPFFNSSVYWMWWLLPLLIIPISVIFSRKRRALKEDKSGQISKKAQRLAKKFLSEAKAAQNNKEVFYIALEKGLQLYVKGKLRIKTADFNKENLQIVFNQKHIDPETVKQFILLLTHCEAARYSPFTSVEINADYSLAVHTISQLDSQL